MTLRRLCLVGMLGVFACLPKSPPVANKPPAIEDAGGAVDAAAPQRAAPALAAVKPAAVKPPLTDKEACGLTAKSGALLSGKSSKPFTRASGRCISDDPFCDWVDVGPDPKDMCFVANRNITRAERESRAVGRGSAASRVWDKKTRPKFFDRVDAHLQLAEGEASLLGKNGFVVLDRLGYASYAVAYHDIFQQQLPVYVSADAILNAVFQASQMILSEVEANRLGPKLVRMIDRMRATLAATRASYGKEASEDLDVYLTVAHRLLHPNSESRARTADGEALVASIVERARGSGGLVAVEIFGRSRMIDFSQLTPRGHYANNDFGHRIDAGKDEELGLDDYFRAMMWLSRFEWNLSSRGSRSSHPDETPDTRETPREARDALAVADLVQRAGLLADLKAFEDTYSVFGGRREDVSVPDLLSLAQKAGIRPSAEDAGDKLRAAIGDSFPRTARTHFMPQGAARLPAIATLFGPRIAPDIAPLTHLVHDAVPDRYEMGAADVAYLLGHDRAKAYMTADLAEHASLGGALDKARAELAAGAKGKADVYSAWISAVSRAADAPKGATPSFMTTDAYADLRMSTALAGYAQIRHTFVLLAGQGYDAYGCEIPDGYVEPALGVYEGILAWSRAARAAAPSRAEYFRRVDSVVSTLLAIARTELSGAALTEPQRRWLGMIAEYTPSGGYADSGEPPKYTGWYFELFPDREHGAERAVDIVADYFTLTNANRVKYIGVEKAALGVFVVDTGGEPRAMVGPVVKPYETETPIEVRLDDEAARRDKHDAAPWTRSYLAPKGTEPSLSATLFDCGVERRVVVESDTDLGDVSVALLDHHGDVITQTVTQRVAKGEASAFTFAIGKDAEGRDAVEGLTVRVGTWRGGRTGSVYDYVDPIARTRAEGLVLRTGTFAPPEEPRD